MSLELTILGCHSATPRANAFPTSQYLQINNKHFLIDCGEGTQRQMRKYKVGFSKIDHIFISHLHGDHFFGLIGLISTYGMLNREKELHIFGPVGIKELIELQLKLTKSYVNFPIHFHELSSKDSEVILDDKKVTVKTIPLKHRIYTNGFLFVEKEKPRKLNMEAVRLYNNIDKSQYNNIKAGRDVVLENGDVIANASLTHAPPKVKQYAYCSDTVYRKETADFVKDSDLLYHEATFLSDKESLAEKTQHSTAKQAAMVANKAQVGQLVLGHYSGRYTQIEDFKKEAQEVFEKVTLAKAGLTIRIDS